MNRQDEAVYRERLAADIFSRNCLSITPSKAFDLARQFIADAHKQVADDYKATQYKVIEHDMVPNPPAFLDTLKDDCPF